MRLAMLRLKMGVPRASGDEPPSKVKGILSVRCSPRERG